MEEVWKDVVGYEGLYQVSNSGRIKSLKYANQYGVFKREKILRKRYDKKGYLHVYLYDKNMKKSFKLHRLIAETFIPNPENKPQVNHINGIKDDNRVENLEWCTNQENQIHAFKIGLQKIKVGSLNPNAKKVNLYDLKGNYINTFGSIKEAQMYLHKNISHISDCCKGKRKTAGNYIWKYAKEG